MALNDDLGNEMDKTISNVGNKGYTDKSLSSDSKALNPMINSGALIVLEMLARTHTVDQVGAWCRADSTNSSIFNEEAVQTTLKDSDRNQNICSVL
jgi:glutaminase